MSESEISITVRTLTHGEHTFKTSKTAPSVRSFITSKLESSTGIPAARQRLLYGGRSLPGGEGHAESAVELGWGDMAQVTLHMVDTDGTFGLPCWAVEVAGWPRVGLALVCGPRVWGAGAMMRFL